MPIQINAPDGTIAQFPDGTPDATITKVMAQNFPPPKPAPNTAVDMARSIPGGLAKGVAGIMGLPEDARQLINTGLDKGSEYVAGLISPGAKATMQAINAKAEGQNLPIGSANINKAMSAPTGGYYKPQTTAGNYAETIASFAPAGIGGGAASLVGRTVNGLTRVALPAMASEAAGQMTQGTAAEPYARAAGALVGGGVGAVLPSVAKTGVRSLNALSAATMGKSFLDPTTEATAQISSALAKDGSQATAQNIAKYQMAGASQPSLVDVAGNNVKRLVRGAAASEGDGQNLAIQYGDTVRGNYQDQLLAHTRGLTPDNSTADQLTASLQKTKSTQAAADYAKANTPVVMTPESLRALRGPDGQAAIDQAIAGARVNGHFDQMNELMSLKTADLDQPPVIQATTLENVRRAFGEMGANQTSAGNKYIGAGMYGRKAGVDTALDATPDLQTARSNFRQNQANIDAVDVGKTAYISPSSDYSANIANLAAKSPNSIAAAGVGHREALVNAIERGPEGATGAANRIATSTQQTNNLATTYGAPAAQKYQSAVSLETQRLRNANMISPNTGSQTALRTQDAAIIDQIPLSRHQFVGAVVDKLRSGLTMTPAERAEVVRIGISPAQVTSLSKNITPRNLYALRFGTYVQGSNQKTGTNP